MFKIGDQVDWLGLKGTVVQTIDTVYGLVHVQFKTMGIGIHIFGSDGAYQAGQEPSLKLVSRPKKKLTLYPALCRFDKRDNGEMSRFYLSDSLYESLEDAKTRDCNVVGLGPAIEIEVPQDEV